MPPFELNTDISNTRDLQASNLSPYDAVYLGNPYCRDYEANFLECLEDLAEAIRQVAGLREDRVRNPSRVGPV